MIRTQLCNWSGGGCGQMHLYSPCMRVVVYPAQGFASPEGPFSTWRSVSSKRGPARDGTNKMCRLRCVCTSYVFFCCWLLVSGGAVCRPVLRTVYGCKICSRGRSKARALSRMVWHNRTAVVLIEGRPCCHSWFCMPLIVLEVGACWRDKSSWESSFRVPCTVPLTRTPEDCLLLTWHLANVFVWGAVCRKAVLFTVSFLFMAAAL